MSRTFFSAVAITLLLFTIPASAGMSLGQDIDETGMGHVENLPFEQTRKPAAAADFDELVQEIVEKTNPAAGLARNMKPNDSFDLPAKPAHGGYSESERGSAGSGKAARGGR